MATTEPLRTLEEVEAVRSKLTSNRDRALFTLALNTAYRGGDLLALNMGDVRGKDLGHDLVIREQKTDTKRRVSLNRACVDALQALIDERSDVADKEPLFVGNKKTRMTIGSLGRMWKDWCAEAGLKGNFASHTGRKSFGYLNRVIHKVPLEVLQKAYGHSWPNVTLVYCCIQPEELTPLYDRNF